MKLNYYQYKQDGEDSEPGADGAEEALHEEAAVLLVHEEAGQERGAAAQEAAVQRVQEDEGAAG